MFTRVLSDQNHSFFLFGPRGTGKSTWIQTHHPHALKYDLLNTSEVIRLSRDPHVFTQEASALSPHSWIVIDEVQKVPDLLNEVHWLIENKKLRFVLSGSSARKLKQGTVNLLAGRARLAHLFPLVSKEVDFNHPIERILQYGTLPTAVTDTDPRSYLKAYVETYLGEEIKAEALTRNIGGFSRFLEIAARQNAQVTNVSEIARDAQVARQTVEGYFEILVDTLMGFWLHPWKLKRAAKQVAHPKFYFFDSGVTRALSGRFPYPPSPEEMGHLFETYMFHEIRAYLSYSKLDFPIYFWKSHEGIEVDLLLETSKGFLAIEFKSTPRWENKFNKGLHRICEDLKLSVRCIGVYLGNNRLKTNVAEVLPAQDFLQTLWSGSLIN